MEHFWASLEGIYIIIDNNYKPLIIFQQVNAYLNEQIKIDELIKLAKTEADSGTPIPPRPIFCNHFEELQTVLFEVELIINNAPLTYVYPNTIETCLTPNHLLFGRQLLYSSNTTSTVVRNLTVLSSTTDKINHISNHFLDRWRHEHALCSKCTWDTTNVKIKYKLPKN